MGMHETEAAVARAAPATAFEVWAPQATRVVLKAGDREYAMSAGQDGWWTAAVNGLGPGADYSYAIDGGEFLPDPRSPFQPSGVHGPSRRVDHAAFPWTDARWRPAPIRSAIFYEAHVGTFTPEGTFEAAIGKLAHLVRLGVTHLELMPAAEFSGPWGWGYDGVDLYAPHHAYGGPEGLKRLVDACHRAGLAVILDVVYNHLGPEGNYLARFGPYFTERYRTPWGGAVNFDGPGSREVRRFFCDNTLMWLRDYHFDGLRLDAVHAIYDHSALHFLEELAGEVERLEAELGRQFALIAESDLNDPRIVRPREVGGYGIHAQWSDDFHHALHTVLTGERDGYYADFGSLAHLAKAVRHGFVYDGGWSPFRRHLHGRSAAGLSGHQFVACWQNHDQVGNRARGDRATHLVSEARLKIAAALLLTAPFLPLLFQGEEWGAQTYFPYFTQHEDVALGVAVREGRRREFGEFGWNPDDVPDPQARRTFESARLDWGEARGEILAWYRSLIALRRALPDLSDGRLDRVHATHHGEERFAMERGAVQVVCNLGRRVELPAGRFSALLLAAGARLSGGWVEMEPDGAAILGDPRDPSVRDYLV